MMYKEENLNLFVNCFQLFKTNKVKMDKVHIVIVYPLTDKGT